MPVFGTFGGFRPRRGGRMVLVLAGWGWVLTGTACASVGGGFTETGTAAVRHRPRREGRAAPAAPVSADRGHDRQRHRLGRAPDDGDHQATAEHQGRVDQ
jgi:hypothetical protein